MLIPFSEYTPDRPSFGGGSLVENVIPMGAGYEPFLGANVYSDALSERPQGFFSCRASDGTVYNFAGSATKLSRLAAAAWSDVSGTTYATGAEERWSFTQFGDRVIACNFANNTQDFLMGTDVAFSDMVGSPPKARYAGTLKDFVVLANTDDGSTKYPTRVQWSPIGNPVGTWGTDAATQADYQDLDTAKGFIRGYVGGEFGLVFQERAITRMSYVGSPLVMQFDEVESDRGTQAPGSIVKVGGMVFYIGTDLKFYQTNGQASAPIGTDKFDKTFRESVDTNYLHRITACRDPKRPIIYWTYPDANANSGRPNRIIAYNWATQRAAPIDLTGSEIEFLSAAFLEGYTLEDLDAFSSSIDALEFSLDSPYWTGGNIELAAFDTSNRLVYMNGDRLDATLDTMEQRPIPEGRAEIIRVRPVIEGSDNATVTIGTRERVGDSVAFGSASSQMSDGSCPVRANGRYVKARVTVPGSDTWTHATGLELEEYSQVGAR